MLSPVPDRPDADVEVSVTQVAADVQDSWPAPAPFVAAQAAETFLTSTTGCDWPEHPRRVEHDDLTVLADDELMERFASAHAWVGYLDHQLGLLEIETQRRKRYAERLLAATTLGLLDQGLFKTRTEAERVASLSGPVVAAVDAADRADDHERLCRREVRRFERTCDMLSREITRRVRRTDHDSRADRFVP